MTQGVQIARASRAVAVRGRSRVYATPPRPPLGSKTGTQIDGAAGPVMPTCDCECAGACDWWVRVGLRVCRAACDWCWSLGARVGCAASGTPRRIHSLLVGGRSRGLSSRSDSVGLERRRLAQTGPRAKTHKVRGLSVLLRPVLFFYGARRTASVQRRVRFVLVAGRAGGMRSKWDTAAHTSPLGGRQISRFKFAV